MASPPPFDPRPDGPVCVALSGGLDSTALLHAVAQDPVARSRGVRALHIHHGLQADADAWVAHCARLCTALGVPLETVRVDVRPHAHLGPEGAARRARFDAFAHHLATGEWLALAHHRDDQAETFLLRALRGSGVDGLASMRAMALFGAGRLWRPWLGVPRTAIRAYAEAIGLEWVEDPMNACDELDRGFLRQHVLPLLETRWPHAREALARAAALSAEAVDLLGDTDGPLLQQLVGDDPATLDLDALSRLPRERRARLLRRWTSLLGLPPLPSGGIAQLEAEVMTGRSDAEAAYRWRGARLERWRDRLHARLEGVAPPVYPGCWDGRSPLRSDQGDRLDLEGLEALPEAARVARRQGGERLRLPGRAHRHALKDLLQALGIPPWQRERLPLLIAADGELLAAGDRIVAARLAEPLHAAGGRLRWMPATGLVGTAD